MLNGDKIRDLRCKRGLTQQALGRAVGMPKNTISLLERRRYPHDVGVMRALMLARELDVGVEELVAGE